MGASRDGLATSLIVHYLGHSRRPELDYTGITRVITAIYKCQMVMFCKILSCEKILASVLTFIPSFDRLDRIADYIVSFSFYCPIGFSFTVEVKRQLTWDNFNTYWQTGCFFLPSYLLSKLYT